MKKVISIILSALLLSSCYLRGYTKVDRPSITDIRCNQIVTSANGSGNGVFRVVLTLSNPETYPVEGTLKCFRTIDLENPIYSEKITLSSRSDKDVSVYTLGSITCEFLVN